MKRSRSLWCLIVVFGALLSGRPVDAAPPVRVGILGMDNYQAVEYVAFFNNPKADESFAGLRVVAVFPVTSADYPESAILTERWLPQMRNLYQGQPDAPPPLEIVNSVDDLLTRCDAVMIWSLDGRMHLQQATSVLKAGKPLFIGRPLASSVDDAIAIFKLARDLKVPCWSCSQHRYSPGFSGMRDHPEVGKVIGCDVYGGFDVKAHVSDQMVRPLHSLETLYAIMGPGCVSAACTSTPTAESITAVWGDGRVGTYRGIKTGAVKYSATVFGDKGVSTAGIYGHGVPVNGIVPTNDKYMGYGGLALELARFFKSGQPRISADETLEIFSLMEAIDESRARSGAFVPLRKLGTPAAN